ncbi:DUF2335 domain-containing protein [Lactobacillus johnsonii]|uniref:DUF2335 domain-containing protein n=1 Tax=Lactobacillus johnsonii TaxID=33959 RepID=A0A9X0J6P4_LACJH|nr:DUF2335 domain-containing protein [Lactobacillus johnsonii]KXN75970.1 hypothetical protein AYJ53_08065 [Lactobacillus johnsonii]
MVNQDKKLPTNSSEEKKNLGSKEDQEIIAQVRKMPISDKKKNDIIATMEMYSGPIPHPKILAGYEALDPGAAEKIINNGIEESVHRRTLETARQKRRGHLAWASMILLLIVCVIFMLGSFYLIMNGHKIIGSIFGGSSFVVLAGSFLNNIDELSKNNDISTNNQDKKDKSA